MLRPHKASYRQATVLKLLPAICASAIAAALPATSASAQWTCDLNGADGGPNATPADGGAAATGSAMACGPQATAINGLAIGQQANAASLTPGTAASTAIAIGSVANANNDGAIAIGGDTNFFGAGAYSIALGATADSPGDHAIAIGGDAFSATTASADESIAIGHFATASSNGAISVGSLAVADGTNSLAIGTGSTTATFDNSVALGAGSANTAANQVNVGGRTIGGVSAGVAATDAVNVGQLNTATAGITSNSAAIAALQTADFAIDMRLDLLEGLAVGFEEDLDRIDDRASSGTATAIALSGMAFLPEKNSI